MRGDFAARPHLPPDPDAGAARRRARPPPRARGAQRDVRLFPDQGGLPQARSSGGRLRRALRPAAGAGYRPRRRQGRPAHLQGRSARPPVLAFPRAAAARGRRPAAARPRRGDGRRSPAPKARPARCRSWRRSAPKARPRSRPWSSCRCRGGRPAPTSASTCGRTSRSSAAKARRAPTWSACAASKARRSAAGCGCR